MDFEQWKVEAADFYRYRYNGERFFDQYPKVTYRAFTALINGEDLLVLVEVKVSGIGSIERFRIDTAGDCFYQGNQISDRNLYRILRTVYSTLEKKIQDRNFKLPFSGNLDIINLSPNKITINGLRRPIIARINNSTN